MNGMEDGKKEENQGERQGIVTLIARVSKGRATKQNKTKQKNRTKKQNKRKQTKSQS